MKRRTIDLWSPAIGAAGSVVAYGHWGRPVLVFPHEMGELKTSSRGTWSTPWPISSTVAG